MKTKQLFWGFLLLTIGALFLLEKFTFIRMEWSFVWDLWPLVLVFWGISVLTKGTAFKPIVSALFGVFLGTMLYGSMFSFSNISYVDNDNYKVSSFSEPLDSLTTSAEFTLNAGAGKFIIKGNTNKLIDIYAKGMLNLLTFNTDKDDSMQSATLEMTNTGVHILPPRVSTKLNIRLNSKPVWDFYFNVGASKDYFDLSEFKVNSIELNMGASEAEIKLGNKYNSTDVEVKMGAANLKIRIPKSSGCELRGDMVLVSKRLNGFDKISPEHYATSNFDGSKNKIFIRIEGGVSKLSVIRY